MRILAISFFDDNFGDMLIRICFDRLLRTALKNRCVSSDDYTLIHEHIKDVSEQLVMGSDLIFFAGGAMFGMNNLGTFENIDTVTAAADKYGVPVVFSSIGINNFNADADSAASLNGILRRSCVKAMSVREDAAIFAPFAQDCVFEPVTVCDPAVWSAFLFREDIGQARASKSQKTVGINFVRGGLFKANGHSWNLANEEKFADVLRQKLSEMNIGCRFFTNGSILDNNSLSHFAQEYDIERSNICYTDSTREVIRSIAGCDAVVAIRMHAAIISYSLGIPSLNLVWNEKIPQFYSAIGHPERAYDADCADPAVIAQAAADLIGSAYQPDQEYMMTLYRFLYDILGEIFKLGGGEMYSFSRVRDEISAMPADGGEDVADYRAKLRRARHFYYKLFTENTENRSKLRQTEKDYKKAVKKLDAAQETIKQQKQELKKLRSQLDYIYSKPLVKVYRKLRGTDKQ